MKSHEQRVYENFPSVKVGMLFDEVFHLICDEHEKLKDDLDKKTKALDYLIEKIGKARAMRILEETGEESE